MAHYQGGKKFLGLHARMAAITTAPISAIHQAEPAGPPWMNIAVSTSGTASASPSWTGVRYAG